MKILISDVDRGHSDLVEQAFLAGYNAYGTFAGTIEKRIESLSASLAYAQANYQDTINQSGTYKYKVRGKFVNAYGEE